MQESGGDKTLIKCLKAGALRHEMRIDVNKALYKADADVLAVYI